jgi:hypothetical protein
VPDTRLQDSSMFTSEHRQPDRYRIMRKGSRYNILGPQGRIFTKYQSASTAGPRWEELTCTPWPYDSTAYERGHRLWELGLIDRTQIGQRQIIVQHPENDSVEAKPTPKRVGRKMQPKQPVKLVVITLSTSRLALPAPKIDLDQHQRLMNALCQNPMLLFTPQIHQALRHEVEYHRPQATWAAHLLKLLDRYERRQRTQQRIQSDAAITAKHLEWQAARMRAVV